MVDIVVAFDSAGCLARLEMRGHAGYGSEGSDPACAAVTLVARSVSRLIASRTGWTVDGDAKRPGNLSLTVNERPGDADEWLGGVTDTLMRALADIEAEYPDSISVSTEEINDGS